MLCVFCILIKAYFGALGRYPGFPDDAALRVSGGVYTTVRNCTFKDLGGGGLVVGNSSLHLTVIDNTFARLGQSGIMLLGNFTAQPNYADILHNKIYDIGLIHGSAGGIVLSAASFVTVRFNTINNIARWGIHVRHFVGGMYGSTWGGKSYHNVIEYNHISNTGTTTSALGGISLISVYGDTDLTNSIIRFNCVKNVIGYADYTQRPYYTYGIFLDNEASGCVPAWSRSLLQPN